jgi:acetyl-CoA carboxylase beta subunit
LTQKKYADRLKDVMENLKTQCVLELENLKVRSFAVWILPLLVDQWGAVGEKISEESITQSKQHSFVMISKSGGARMMEAAYSLMQCKTS